MEDSNQETSRNNLKDSWQAEVLGQIYDTDFVEITAWIGEGALQPSDKVRRGNLRWIEARKVPMLIPFFNAKEQGIEPPAVQTSFTDSGEAPAENFTATENFVPDQALQNHNSIQPEQSFQPKENHHSAVHNSQVNDRNLCVLHPEYEAKFHCETCANVFCGQCPKSYGGNVKICPMCGAMLKKIGEYDLKKERELRRSREMSEGFGFTDVVKSFAHPLKYNMSFLFGGAMFMIFSVGQSAYAFGGIFMIFASLICFLLTNMLSFGILSNTVENFSKGNTEADFMPKFDDFNIWDTVVHPFLITIAVYISSFGPMILTIIIAVAVPNFIGGRQAAINQAQIASNQNVQTTSPYLVDEKRAVEQSQEVKKLLEGVKQTANEKRQLTENGLENSSPVLNENQQADEPIKSIPVNKNQQFEETQPQEMQASAASFFKAGIILFIFMMLSILWAIFYFPAACTVAGYTQSFWATINPLVGIDTIKTLGFDYVKILGVFIFIGIAMILISGFFWIMLSAFSLVGMGNVPATAISSWFTFYFTIVFSCIIGFALYKNSDKFKFYKG